MREILHIMKKEASFFCVMGFNREDRGYKVVIRHVWQCSALRSKAGFNLGSYGGKPNFCIFLGMY